MKKWIVIILLATSLFIALTLIGERSSAVLNQLPVLFEPEKKVVQEIEGHKEETDVYLNEGSHAKYVLYIDESRYTMTYGEEADVIQPKDALPDRYPEVSMEIRQVPDVAPDQLVMSVSENLKREFPELLQPEYVQEPLEGWQLHGIMGGQEWDSPVIHVYIVSNGQSGSFVITQRYFLEAAEGHGARFDVMLKEFQLIEE